ncbi:RNA-binding transcriptional accessory protein [Thalassomonas viridans]|uniref:RNA-binding transcriptional accessory protein n=1 Tax=Thalassomonas viridans TaxID=137584 RepID=A0AAE9Z2G4_9GAMM|nr:Tex family protein [Thalassomonas viridans]WDE05561.1 RNA-binding transcriptional accessory protein [Thalassomonas viridans]
MTQIAEQIAKELNVKVSQVSAAVALLDEGSTVPFIARYRKEATEGLDDNHLRHLDQRLSYLRDLEDRRQVILTNIEQQGKLTAELKAGILAADNKTRLEDLYLPYRPKRRTKGQIAIEAGIEPLADKLYQDWQVSPEQAAKDFINPDAGFKDEKAVLDGACYILIERFAEDADLLQKLRRHLLKQAHLTSSVVKDKEKEAAKYRDYFEHSELLKNVPSHRALAMFRGRNEGYLQLNIDVDPGQEDSSYSSAEQLIMDHFSLRLSGQAAAEFLTKVVRWSWKVKLSLSLENELLGQLREQAEAESIKVFSSNLSDLLMASPAGAKTTLGLDPGLRTGCKIAVVDGTGKLLYTTTIFPHAPQNHWDKSIRTLVNLCQQYKVELIAIGNGTASRESDKLVAEAIQTLESNKPSKIMVSEAGASVYSASEFAANEFPELDVSLRGAVSIARRLQDPLAELVKIDPKAIGVGQYQHDVSQSLLSKTLDDVIEDCVNAVGVDLNSASVPLLARVSGLTKTMAQNVVAFRDANGRFNNRKELIKVPRLGPKAFEQAAGFLRISDGDNPLDKSGVHPETYPVVEQVTKLLNRELDAILGDGEVLKKVNTEVLINDKFGKLTVLDVLKELEKPGRDPRPEFKTATFHEGVNTIADLKVGMILEGVISNVANFGAFVDIGVHQDGLVHISSLTDKFVSDPREVVKAGDIVKVKVVEVDAERKRISLTMRLDEKVSDKPSQKKAKGGENNGQHHKGSGKPGAKHGKGKSHKPKEPANAAMGNAFADAFAKLKK